MVPEQAAADADRKKTKVFLVEDHAMFSSLVSDVLVETARFTIVGTATTGEEALVKITQARPDVILLDLALPDMSGLEVLQHLAARKNPAHVVVCSSAAYPPAAAMAFALGARGWASKDLNISDLVAAVETAAAGQYSFSPLVMKYVRENILAAGKLLLPKPGDLAIFRMLVQGLTARQIAAERKCVPGQVYKARDRIMRCTQSRTEQDLLKAAQMLGILRVT